MPVVPRFRGLKAVLLLPMALAGVGCDSEHRGHEIESFQGDYRYSSGVGEFFDCQSRVRYYVHDSSANKRLIREYRKLGLQHGDDAYVRVKGYLKEVPQMEGVDPVKEFVPAEFISIDPNRGCKQEARRGR